MRYFLFIWTLLFGMLFFSSPEEVESNIIDVSSHEAVMKEKSATDAQNYLTILSTDLKETKGLTTRRTVQPTSNTFHLRTLRIAEKILRDLRLKEMNTQRKVLENVSECQTINLSTLFCRMAQHVFALRKLII